MIEDDAQDGPDHVDSHRSTCYVICPFIKRGPVDHTFYNTDSVLKTMELLLGVPADEPVRRRGDARSWTSTPRPATRPRTAPSCPPQNVISDLNPSLLALKPGTVQYRMAELSNTMDFVHPDSAPAHLLNEIIWKSVKGVDAKMPAPRHTLTDAQAPLRPPLTAA